MNFSPSEHPTAHAPSRVRMGLRMRALLFISAFLALAIGITVVAMSWNARTIVIEQVERDVEVLSSVLSQSIAVSQQLPDQVEDVLGQGMQATAATLAPCRSSTCAVARPMPEPAPVTRACRPESSRLSGRMAQSPR